MSIVNLEPVFIIQEPKEDNYKFVIRAFNEKGPSQIVEILKENIINATLGKNIYIVFEIVPPDFRSSGTLNTLDFPSSTPGNWYNFKINII